MISASPVNVAEAVVDMVRIRVSPSASTNAFKSFRLRLPPPLPKTTHRSHRRVYGVRAEGNVDPAVDVHGELTSQNVLFKNETVEQAAQALGVSEE